MQTTTLSNLPPQVQQILPELIALNSAQRLTLIHWLSTKTDQENLLKQAIKDGLDSPLVEGFDFKTHLAELKNK